MDACAWHAGRFHDDLDPRIGNQRFRVVGDERRALLVRIGERACGVSLIRPARSFELAACTRDVEIGDADEMHAARQPGLRHEHGAELAGADQADGHRPPGSLAFQQFGMKVHARNGNTGSAATQAPLTGSKGAIGRGRGRRRSRCVHSGPVERPDI